MTETVAQAAELATVAPRMLDESRWADVLPAHIGAAKFQRWALGIMQKPELLEVARTPIGQLSITTALLDCASLGLEPGRTYHLVPYKGIVKGMTDYKGEIQLITNANPAASVIAMLVHKEDDFHLTGANIPPKHDADWFGDRGPVIGGYSFVDYGSRYSLVVRMSEADFLHHRAKAPTKDVWDEWPEPMRFKTLIHPLRKTEPWSAEVRQR
jgi:recombination protein RecT